MKLMFGAPAGSIENGPILLKRKGSVIGHVAATKISTMKPRHGLFSKKTNFGFFMIGIEFTLSAHDPDLKWPGRYKKTSSTGQIYYFLPAPAHQISQLMQDIRMAESSAISDSAQLLPRDSYDSVLHIDDSTQCIYLRIYFSKSEVVGFEVTGSGAASRIVWTQKSPARQYRRSSISSTRPSPGFYFDHQTEELAHDPVSEDVLKLVDNAKQLSATAKELVKLKLRSWDIAN